MLVAAVGSVRALAVVLLRVLRLLYICMWQAKPCQSAGLLPLGEAAERWMPLLTCHAHRVSARHVLQADLALTAYVTCTCMADLLVCSLAPSSNLRKQPCSRPVQDANLRRTPSMEAIDRGSHAPPRHLHTAPPASAALPPGAPPPARAVAKQSTMRFGGAGVFTAQEYTDTLAKMERVDALLLEETVVAARGAAAGSGLPSL